MKRILEFFKEIIDSKLSWVFFIANLIVCPAAFDWGKSFSYFEKIHEAGCKPQPKINFGIYDNYGGRLNIIDLLCFLLCVAIIFLILFFFLAPSGFACGVVLGILKAAHPGWCAETFDLITIPIFMIINGFYWAVLGRAIESIYLTSIRDKPARKNPLSIISN